MAKHRLLFIFIGVALLAVASLPFLMSASCLTRPQTPGEQKALDNLRSMTRNDVLPAENVVADIENQFPRTKAAALARILRARIKSTPGISLEPRPYSIQNLSVSKRPSPTMHSSCAPTRWSKPERLRKRALSISS